MSSHCLRWAWKQVTGISGTEKNVLARLADMANDEGVCWPGKTSLSSECCLSKRTVDAAINSLQSMGYISVQPRRTESGKPASNYYILHVDRPAQSTLFDPAADAGMQEPQECSSDHLEVQEPQGIPAGAAPELSLELSKNRKPSATAVAGSAQSGYRTRKGKLLAGKALAQFEYFWNEFHRGWEKRGKAEAGDAWYALTQGEELPPRPWVAIITGAKAEAQVRAGLIARGLTPKMAEGWLSGRRWEDYEPQADPDPRKPRARPPEPPWYEDISGILAKAGEFGMGIGRNTDCLEAAEFVIRQLEERGADPPPELVQWRDLMQDAKAEEAA